MNMESSVTVLTDDFKPVPYKNLELALKSEFQCVIISNLANVKLCKDVTPDHILFVNKGQTQPQSELNLKGWTATWKMRDEGAFNIYNYRLDWSHYSPDGIRRNLDVSRYSGNQNIYTAIKELVILSQFPDWNSFDLYTQNIKLRSEVDKLKEEIASLENKLSSIKQLLD